MCNLLVGQLLVQVFVVKMQLLLGSRQD